MSSPSLESSSDRSARKVTLLVTLAAAIPFGFLVAHYHWLCDDAFISFRYAKNLADGHGLRFNISDAPIEGYSNFLWVVLLAGARRVGLDIPTTAWVLSIASAALLFFALAGHLARHRRASAWTILLPLLVAATLPPLAAWSTSGLATMPAALAVFVLWDSLFGHERPRPGLALPASVVAVLLRADTFLLVGLVHALALGLGGWREPGRLRTLLISAAVAALTFAGLTWFRWSYFGDWLPNTARVKTPADAVSFERGLAYDVNFLLTFLAVPGALVCALAGPWRDRRRASAWLFLLAIFAYAAWVGGDFMAMGRLLVVTLPFAIVLAGGGLDRIAACCRPGVLAALAAAALLSGASTATVLERYPIPKATLERWFFRWSSSEFYTEIEQWNLMKAQGLRWSDLGRALKAHTQPNESLIRGTIGAVGYFSDLHVYDTFGLTNESWKDHPPKVGKRSSPGHERHIPITAFLASDPTYANVDLVQTRSPEGGLPRVLNEYENRLDKQWIPLPNVPGGSLRLVRWKPAANRP